MWGVSNVSQKFAARRVVRAPDGVERVHGDVADLLVLSGADALGEAEQERAERWLGGEPFSDRGALVRDLCPSTTQYHYPKSIYLSRWDAGA